MDQVPIDPADVIIKQDLIKTVLFLKHFDLVQ